ncbi:hypothetical protein DB31_7161 [Hyalangium minutum]|uniref:Uncharacterized protein n=1 Tax=Hyalangium minutum TaxID=394096 RepID=A0A085WJR1_9BACT|nr:hypothetical protein DB31_7161 [Hyalangium minutum]
MEDTACLCALPGGRTRLDTAIRPGVHRVQGCDAVCASGSPS